MRIAAPPEWADRTLSACEVGGDPFRVAFDSRAEADVTESQFHHLVTFSGIALQRCDPWPEDNRATLRPEAEEDAEQAADPETSVPSAAEGSDTPQVPASTRANTPKRSRGSKQRRRTLP